MAAVVMSCVRYSFSNNFNIIMRTLEPQIKHVSCIRFFKSEAALIEEASVIDQTEQNVDEDLDLERKRNKSRLSTQHRNLLFDENPYSESKVWYHDTVKYKRRMYGRYGSKSGVNPGLMWPTHQELDEAKEFEAVAFSRSIQEMMQINDQKKEEAVSAIKDREEDITKKMAKLEQWKADINKKIEKKIEDERAAKERKDRLVEEVRRHFGFKVDPREDRFKEMLAAKEKAERKSLKDAKKKAKEDKMILKLSNKQLNEEKSQQPQE